MAKAAFWQNKEVTRRNVIFGTKKKIIDCYVFSVLNYGCEGWTWNKEENEMSKKMNASEMWSYKRMLKICWKDRITNVEVLQRMHTSLHFMNNIKKRKLEYAEHVMRGSSGETHLYNLEGKIYGKKPRGRPRRI